jgi:hypothetical protein
MRRLIVSLLWARGGGHDGEPELEIGGQPMIGSRRNEARQGWPASEPKVAGGGLTRLAGERTLAARL